MWPSALHLGWPHLHGSSFPSSETIAHQGRAPLDPEHEKPPPCEAQAICRGTAAPGRKGETPEGLLNWPSGLLGTSAGWWMAAFVLFWDPHIFLCTVGQAAPLCYRSCDVERDETLSWSLGCVRLCTLHPFGQVCHYLDNGPYCAFLGLDKAACVCGCMYTSAEDTPGRPGAPGMPVPGAPRRGVTRGTSPWPASLTTSRSLC